MAIANPALIEAMVPFYLMPVAALIGLYVLYALVRTLFVLYTNATTDKAQLKRDQARERLMQSGKNSNSQMVLQSSDFAVLFLSLILSLIAYAFVVARVEAGYQRAEYRSFDPYGLLGLTKPAAGAEDLEASVIQDAFKSAVAMHKAASSDEDMLEQLKLAYTALSDERSMLNYQRFGHPLGELELGAFRMTLPIWLQSPTGPFANVLYVIYAGAVLFVIYSVVMHFRNMKANKKKAQTEEEKQKAAAALLDQSNSVSKEDLKFLVENLKPTSTHLEILWALCATPDNLAWSLRNLEAAETVRQERLNEGKAKKPEEPKKDDLAAMLDGGGWDGEDEDKDAAEKKELQNKATGQTKVLLEGLDEGVLGQHWVEETLAQHKQWPPKTVDMFKGIDYNGKKIEKVMDHPGLRRLLCMMMGRLNSQMLNSHPQLLQAGAKKLIDQTYFSASLEFRQRVGLLLEGALRVSMMLRSHQLVARIIETVALFRIGCVNHPNSLKWFQSMMLKSNGCLPAMQVHSKEIVSVDYGSQVCAGDKCEYKLDMERTHAENFTKAKVALCQKQGIPPQAALQGYREGWWLLLRCERLDGATPPQEMNKSVLEDLKISEEAAARFGNEKPEDQLMGAIPLMVQNIAQKRGQFQMRFQAPEEPGKYKYTLTVKSQDFLGCDQILTLTMDVLDPAKVDRKKMEEEPKKDK